ncbi:methyl-accepting chemotaxis protein [Gammaproteobacteria bacterium]
MIRLLSRWSVTTTMRVISGLSLITFLVIIGMNYRAIGQVHAIGSEINQTTQHHKDLWQTIALCNARAESLRYALLHTQDVTTDEQIHQILGLLNTAATAAIQDQEAQKVKDKATEYSRLFDALTHAFEKKSEKVHLLQQQREALETLVYETNDAAVEEAITDLKPGEVLYFWNPTLERAKSVEVLLDRLDRDVSGHKNENRIQQSSRIYRDTLHALIEVEAEVKRLGEKLGVTAMEVEKIVSTAVAKTARNAEAAISRSELLVTKAQSSALLWTLLGILVPIALTFLFDRSFSSRIQDLVASLHQVAKGNLSTQIETIGNDEIAALARATNEMRTQLDRLVTRVETTAGNIYSSANEISLAMDNQAATATQMSVSVSEIGSTMEELSASSTEIAEHSKAVVEIAYQTWETGKKGSESMQTVVEKMNDIKNDNQRSLKDIVELSNKSKEIGHIMEIIDVVADQTKLIAFNAALEASSAGEAGRRFGVVAAEIRRLADSVSESTTEISRKVNEIQDAIHRMVVTSEKGALVIQTGLSEVAVTANRLTELVDAVQHTNNAAQQISLSTQQQKLASNQVVVALREIVSASANTAQSVERISQVSKGMVGLSTELKGLVGQFQLTREEPNRVTG